jgi:hypothetical protein
MSGDEITFNTNLSDPTRTRADFTYKITPAMTSITETGLGKCSVTEDIEAVLRKIEHWHQAQSQSSRSCAATAKDSGTGFVGTAKPRCFALLTKPTNEKPARNYSSEEGKRGRAALPPEIEGLEMFLERATLPSVDCPSEPLTRKWYSRPG